jgi:hypothetical protein
VGEDLQTEIFIRDPEVSAAILVTYTDPIECADLDRTQVVGVGWLMSEKHIQILEQEGRLNTFEDYTTLASLCTTCGKQNSIWLAGISAFFVVMGLAIYPFVLWSEKRTGQSKLFEIALTQTTGYQKEAQMSFLKKILGGTSKNTGDSPEILKRRQQAAVEMLGIFQEHLPTTFESHPATALIAAAWLAATSLYRSMGYPPNIEPGTVVISETIEPKWPRLINLYLSVIERDGIKMDRDEMLKNVSTFKIPPAYQPKKDIAQIQEMFQGQYNQIMRRYGFDYEGGAQVGVFACAIMTAYHCVTNQDLEPELAAKIVCYGFFVGGISAPVPLQ